jgi:hypothetical protein
VSILIPIGLYLLALAIRLLVAGEMPFPTTEPSAFYTGVAQNLVAGDGLVTNALWSYATPPLEIPRPAFTLWLPMSTFVSAAAMPVLGSTFWAAQVGTSLLGALVAPLAWAIAQEAARTQGLEARRRRATAVASGLLAAVLSPLVLGSVVPDSYMPFTVFVLIAALLIPRVIGVRDGKTDAAAPSVLAGLGLGLAMGLAYLARQEAVWLGLTVLLMLAWAARGQPAGTRLRGSVDRLWPVVVGGLIVVVPWLARNWVEFGSPLPGQAVENMFLVANEDIYAFRDRPDAATYLDQGLATVLWNPIAAAWDNVLGAILLPAFPVGVAGLISLVGMRHSAALRRPTALVAVLASALLTFVSTMLLFPVATLWGTFLHSSGPLLVGLCVVASLGGDALMTRLSELRGWEKPNVILAPVALVGTAGLLLVFQVSVFADLATSAERRYEALARSIDATAAAEGIPVPDVVIADRPVWVAAALDGNAVALPDEDLDSILELSEAFDTPWVVVMDERGRYPDALLTDAARACLDADPVRIESGEDEAWLFRLAEACTRM